VTRPTPSALNSGPVSPYHRLLMFKGRTGLASLGLVVLGASVLLSRGAGASLILALDLPSMVSRADNVAVVDVMSVKSAWDARHERILTTVDMAVVESWKGPMAPAAHVSVVQRGGTVDDTEMIVFGMPRFATGERALVFLAGRPERASVVGMAQGKRLLQREAATGRWMVGVPDRAGATFVPPSPATPAAPVFEIRARPLEELRDQVKALAASTGKVP